MAAEIRLEPLVTGHAPLYFDLFSDPEVCRYMDLLPFVQKAEGDRFVRHSLDQKAAGRSERWTLYLRDAFAGTVTFYAIMAHQSRASVGYALKREFWGCGHMGSVLRMAEDLALQDLRLHRLQATVLVENKASARVLQKAGYLREGLLRDYEQWEGRGFVDLEMYAKIL